MTTTTPPQTIVLIGDQGDISAAYIGEALTDFLQCKDPIPQEVILLLVGPCARQTITGIRSRSITGIQELEANQIPFHLPSALLVAYLPDGGDEQIAELQRSVLRDCETAGIPVVDVAEGMAQVRTDTCVPD